jgi:hypothetical protein
MANRELRAESARFNPTIQPLSRSALLSVIRGACERHGIPESRFGRDAAGDPALVRDLRSGRQPGPIVQAKVLAFLASIGEA